MGQRTGWTLFTLRGVPLNLHFSLLFLLVYVFAVAAGQFSYISASAGVEATEVRGSPVTWALVFAFALVVSIVVHEFSHVFMAQALGIRTRRITLMMLGGASEMEHLPEKPSHELKVAIVGPLVSLAIGVSLYMVYWTTSEPSLKLFSYWIGQLNVVLGVFNLLPAFPTDGGRVLRAALVSRQGRVKGTRNAVAVSRVFAWTFGILGLLSFNLLLILIALFVSFASRSELFLITASESLKGLRVRDVVFSVHGILASRSLEAAAAQMVEEKSTAIPVASTPPGAGKFGVLSATLLSRIPRSLWSNAVIEEYVDLAAPVLDQNQVLDEQVLGVIVSAPDGVPVKDGNDLVGIVRSRDLFEFMQLRDLERRGSVSTRPAHQS